MLAKTLNYNLNEGKHLCGRAGSQAPVELEAVVEEVDHTLDLRTRSCMIYVTVNICRNGGGQDCWSYYD